MSNSILYYKKGGVVLPVNTHLKPLQTQAITYGAGSLITPVTVTSSATPHVKGAWTELVSSTPAAANVLELNADGTILNGFETSALLDIGFGSLGAEVVQVENLAVGYRNIHSTAVGTPLTTIPLTIPQGTRISARLQATQTSDTVDVRPRTMLLPFGVGNSNGIDTIGANTSNSRGVTLSAPGSLNTKGAWTEITASTANAYKALFIEPQGAGAVTFTAGGIGVDVAVGASGSEQPVVHDVLYLSTTSETYSRRMPAQNLYYVDIPAGSRISARYQRAAANNTVDLIVYGVK